MKRAGFASTAAILAVTVAASSASAQFAPVTSQGDPFYGTADAAPAPTATPEPIAPEPTPAVIDPRFVDHFGRSPVPDVPIPRVARHLQGGRLVVRAFGSAGIQLAFADAPWRTPYATTNSSGFDAGSAGTVMPAFTAGIQTEFRVVSRFSLVGDLAFRTVPGILPGTTAAYAQRSLGSMRTDSSVGTLDWSAGYGLDFTGSMRFATPSRFFVGLGVRYGFTRTRALATLRDVSNDSDANIPGTREGTMKVVLGGSTLGGVLDLGSSVGARGATVALRSAFGVPFFTSEVVVAIPIYGGSR